MPFLATRQPLLSQFSQGVLQGYELPTPNRSLCLFIEYSADNFKYAPEINANVILFEEVRAFISVTQLVLCSLVTVLFASGGWVLGEQTAQQRVLINWRHRYEPASHRMLSNIILRMYVPRSVGTPLFGLQRRKVAATSKKVVKH